MVTYLYCVLSPTKSEAFPVGLAGIGDALVRPLVVRQGDVLEAWVASVDESMLQARGAALAKLALLHNEVVEAAMATGQTPLPARFGTRFANDEMLLANLAARRGELRDRLDRLAGTIEISVLVVPTRKEKPVAPPRRHEAAAGRRYLESIRERTRSEEQRSEGATRVADRVSQTVSAITRGEVRSTSSSVLSIAHLVWLADLERYRVALSELDVGAEFRIVVGRPHAPYSFSAA